MNTTGTPPTPTDRSQREIAGDIILAERRRTANAFWR